MDLIPDQHTVNTPVVLNNQNSTKLCYYQIICSTVGNTIKSFYLISRGVIKPMVHIRKIASVLEEYLVSEGVELISIEDIFGVTAPNNSFDKCLIYNTETDEYMFL